MPHQQDPLVDELLCLRKAAGAPHGQATAMANGEGALAQGTTLIPADDAATMAPLPAEAASCGQRGFDPKDAGSWVAGLHGEGGDSLTQAIPAGVASGQIGRAHV